MLRNVFVPSAFPSALYLVIAAVLSAHALPANAKTSVTRSSSAENGVVINLVGDTDSSPAWAGSPTFLTLANSGSDAAPLNSAAEHINSYVSRFDTVVELDDGNPYSLSGNPWFLRKKDVVNIDSALRVANDTPEAIAAVPEPETYALILAGLGLVGWVARRRRR